MEALKLTAIISQKDTDKFKRLFGSVIDASYENKGGSVFAQIHDTGRVQAMFVPREESKELRKILIPLWKKAIPC